MNSDYLFINVREKVQQMYIGMHLAQQTLLYICLVERDGALSAALWCTSCFQLVKHPWL